MKTTTKSEEEEEEEPEKKIHRVLTSLDDDELWSEFEMKVFDRILSGEVEPKTMIITDDILPSQYQMYGGGPPQPTQWGPILARHLLKLFPNSQFHSLHVEEAAAAGERQRVTKQECGPQFTLILTSVEKYDFDTGEFEVVCKPVGSLEP